MQHPSGEIPFSVLQKSAVVIGVDKREQQQAGTNQKAKHSDFVFHRNKDKMKSLWSGQAGMQGQRLVFAIDSRCNLNIKDNSIKMHSSCLSRKSFISECAFTA